MTSCQQSDKSYKIIIVLNGSLDDTFLTWLYLLNVFAFMIIGHIFV